MKELVLIVEENAKGELVANAVGEPITVRCPPDQLERNLDLALLNYFGRSHLPSSVRLRTSDGKPFDVDHPMPKIPMYDLGSDPYERGLQHGRTLGFIIRSNIETYLEFYRQLGLNKDEVFRASLSWAKRCESLNHDYALEMKGVSDGSGISLAAIGMLNTRYEVAYSCLKEKKSSGTPSHLVPVVPDACTSVGVMPEKMTNDRVVLAQNWDWLAYLYGRLVIMRVRPKNGPAFLSLTQAGIVGGMLGLNEAGLGLCINAMVTSSDGECLEGKPFHLCVYEILQKERMDQAMKVVIENKRAGSTNFLFGHADGEIVSLEATPERVSPIYPQDGIVTHANHLENHNGLGPGLERIYPCSLVRTHRLRRLISKEKDGVSYETIKTALHDHFDFPKAICAHPDPAVPEILQSSTLSSVILNLNDRTMYATDGWPCKRPYLSYRL